MQGITLGMIVGNRGFFPDHLCESGRQEMLEVLEKAGIKVIALTPEDTKFGTVESIEDAQKCAALFKAHQDEIDGILVTLPNFGDERAVANSIRWSGLQVPVLVHAFADDAGKMTLSDRRDSFCGKMSVCNNLKQYGIAYSLTQKHTISPSSPVFSEDLAWFSGVCRVVKGLKNARIGAIGTRPANFNTVRYSEKLLERYGISVEPIDLSEVFGQADHLADNDPAVTAKLQEIRDYIDSQGVPTAALLKMAKFSVVVDRWMKQHQLTACAVQCWTSMETYFGIAPCAIMSMLSNNMIPSACEVDVPGALSMYALQLASGRPAALVDWNNNYGDEDDKAVFFHCSNLPKDVLGKAKMDFQAIVAGDVGQENAYGTVVGRMKPGALTYCRISTDDVNGNITAYLGEGQSTNDTLLTFGGYGVVQIPRLQELLAYICNNAFEHHVAVTMASVARAVDEALTKYMGWQVYHHR